MIEIIGIRFKSVGKIYYFAPGKIKAEVGDRVIVETVRGIECGEVVIANREIDDSELSVPLKPIIRIATEKDKEFYLSCEEKKPQAMTICREKISILELEL